MTGPDLCRHSGFTIIELLVYMGLFAIIIGGALVGVYQIVESTQRNQAYVVIEQEGNFLVRKIEWALNGATAISAPAPDTAGTTLRVTAPDGTSTLAAAGESLTLAFGTGAERPLSSQNIQVQNLTFENLSGRGVKVEFDLASQGKTRHFSSVKYLR